MAVITSSAPKQPTAIQHTQLAMHLVRSLRYLPTPSSADSVPLVIFLLLLLHHKTLKVDLRRTNSDKSVRFVRTYLSFLRFGGFLGCNSSDIAS